jgi:hypothetical protein
MDPAAASNDDRLKRLEDRLETLLLELRELKSGDKAGAVPAIPPKPAKLPKQNTVNPLIPTTPGTDPRPAMDSKMQMQIDMLNRYVAKATRADGAVDAVTLTRSTYKLPPGKADEIAAFLKENLTDDIEVRVKDHNLQVTASAEDQTAIASFVRLLQTRGTAATKHKASEQLRRNSSGAPKGSRDANPDYDFEGSDADAFVPRKNRAPDAARDRGRPIGF